MTFKLTYRDGQEDDYDDNTAWVVEGGVLKMGREPEKWTVLVSPSHWATIEVQPARAADDDKNSDDDDKDNDNEDNDSDNDDNNDDKNDNDDAGSSKDSSRTESKRDGKNDAEKDSDDK